MGTATRRKPQPQFDNLLNFRDVANTVNTINSVKHIRSGLLFRSARPDETSLSDREKLVTHYHIKTVVDLRTKTEHINALQKHTATSARVDPSTNLLSNEVVAQPLKIPGLEYAEINLNGKGFERSLVWKLKYLSLLKMLFLLIFGYRMNAIAIIAKEVLQPRGLIGLGIDTLEHSGPEIKEVFDTFADRSSYPVLVHCTQGKDRTGIIIALVLLLCNIDMTAISADYVRSEVELEPGQDERRSEISSIGLDESFSKCPPEFVPRIVEHLEKQYGGAEGYLSHIGVDAHALRCIKETLCG